MNPGHELGVIAVTAAYAVVLAAILFFMKMNSNRAKRLEKRRQELKNELR
jgi:Flp pilus assembly protein TadB